MTRSVNLARFLAFSFLTFISSPLLAFDSKQPFDISADMIEYDDETLVLMAEGHVVVLQGSSTLHADHLRYDRQNKRLFARGSVLLRDQGAMLVGDIMNYDLELQKGDVQGGKGFGSPWYFQGAQWEKNLDYMLGRQTSFTTCDLIDPHYHIRASRVHLIPDKIFWAWNNTFYTDDMPMFYSPFMYKYLGNRRVVFQANPGHDSVKGSFARTVTTIRFTDRVYDKVLLDLYTISGTGVGNEFNYSSDTYKGSLFGYYIDPKGQPELVGAPKAPQYNVRSYHWQTLGHGAIFQSNINRRKNVSFNNQFLVQDNNLSVHDINNSVAISQTARRLTHRLVMETFEAPDAGADPLYGAIHTQSASLPRYEANFFQRPLWSPTVSTNTLDQVLHPHHLGALQLSGNVNGENSYSRIDDDTRLKANGSASLSLPININRQWSFSAAVTPSLRWQDKFDPFVNTSTSGAVVVPVGFFRGYQGRMSGSGNLRYRPFSAMTLDNSYTLTTRLAPNELELDKTLNDGGIETNHLNWLLFWRPSRLIMLRSFSGYDLRELENEDPHQYSQRRVDPLTNELSLHPSDSNATYFFRHQLGYYPTRTLYWAADARWTFPHKTYLESGISYNASVRGQLTWNNKAGFYFSPSWKVESILNTQVPNDTLHLTDGGKILQSQFLVTRIMHCWDIQFIYRNLPPFTREYSLLFNVRLGTQKLKEMANNEVESQFYPWRAER